MEVEQVSYDWSQWESFPSVIVTCTCTEREPLGLNTDGGSDGTVYVESVRPSTWAARMNVKTPCSIAYVNGVDVKSLSAGLFSEQMQQRPVTISFKLLHRKKARIEDRDMSLEAPEPKRAKTMTA
jgi:hypothetical protein